MPIKVGVFHLQASKHPSAFEIAAVVGIAESTVQIAYSNLKSEARTLIPAWFAKPEEVAIQNRSADSVRQMAKDAHDFA